jgi:hypothetical protein
MSSSSQSPKRSLVPAIPSTARLEASDSRRRHRLPLCDGETTAIGHVGIEGDDLEDAKAELTRRGVVLQGKGKTDDVHGT